MTFSGSIQGHSSVDKNSSPNGTENVHLHYVGHDTKGRSVATCLSSNNLNRTEISSKPNHATWMGMQNITGWQLTTDTDWKSRGVYTIESLEQMLQSKIMGGRPKWEIRGVGGWNFYIPSITISAYVFIGSHHRKTLYFTYVWGRPHPTGCNDFWHSPRTRRLNQSCNILCRSVYRFRT